MTDGSALDLATAIGMMNRGNSDQSSSGGYGSGGYLGVFFVVLILFIMFAGFGRPGTYGSAPNNNSDATLLGMMNMMNNGRYNSTNELSNEFLYSNLSNTLNQGFTQVANQSFGIDKSICQGVSSINSNLNNGFNGVQMQMADNRYATQSCCCETNRNIDSVRYDNAKNTCDIIQASNANTQKILDKMCESEVNRLRTDLQTANLAISNMNQTQNIVNQLRPVPQPAYLTLSPYASYPFGLAGTGCNCGTCGQV
jgi:hypothetical protein